MAHLSAKKGDSITLELLVTRSVPGPTPADAPTVTPVNLSGAVELWFTAKRDPGDADGDAVVRLGNGPTGLTGVEVTDAVGGIATVRIPAAVTDVLERGTVWLYYDAQLQELDGTITTVAAGRLALTDDITRST